MAPVIRRIFGLGDITSSNNIKSNVAQVISKRAETDPDIIKLRYAVTPWHTLNI